MQPIKTLLAAGVALFTVLGGFEAVATTYTWDQQALGQVYLTCFPSGGGQVDFHWPSNSLWSQSVVLGRNCDNTADVISQPSNWSPAPATGLFPGGPGAEGVDVVLGAPANTQLDANVTLRSLTVQASGGLSIAANTTARANRFDFQGDGSLLGGGITITTGGTLVKSGGTGTFSFGSGYITQLTGHRATIEVKSGTLAFPAGNNYTTLDGGGTFAVSNNATIILAPDSNTGTFLTGDFSGVGGGTVLLNAGNLNCSLGCSLNLPGNMFQWTGGNFYSGSVTNNGVFNLTNTPGLQSANLFNNRTVNLADQSSFNIGGAFYNNVAGTFDIRGDSSVTPNAGDIFSNSGLVKKSAGTGWSPILMQFWNYGGTVEVDSGTLAVGLYNGSVISNATFLVNSGATLDLSISNNNMRISGLLTGSGGGTVFMNNGSVRCDTQMGAATLNFPGAMFQWAGGTLGGESSVFLTNAGILNLSGPAVMDTYFANNGTIIQSGVGDNVGGGAQFANNTAGVYRIQNDNGIAVDSFNNFGRLEKTGGAGTSVIHATFNNSGAIAAASGTLLFTAGTFNQNAGTLQMTPAITFTNQAFYLNGGTVTGVGTVGDNNVIMNGGVLAPGNPFGTLKVPFSFNMSGGAFNVALGSTNQFSQLAAGNASLNGTLKVTLTNGYVPAIGTQFQIVSCLNRAGGFAALNMPQGTSVNYSNTGVYLVVTGSVPAQLQSPQVNAGDFNFDFGTASGQSYTIQQNTNLATTNWTFYTNITGNGSVYQFTTPVTNIPQRFFRIRQP